MNRIAAALLLPLLCCGAAQASQQGLVVQNNWKVMDNCTKQAQTAFPDFTAEANAKRDAKLKECLAGRNLPPRDPMSPGR
ncbi:MAG TPA: hypothetical protein VF007_03900 [Stellaceae bacterium]